MFQHSELKYTALQWKTKISDKAAYLIPSYR
jgi:hypothetical protein